MRMKLVAFLGAAFVAVVLAQPVLAAKGSPQGGGRAGSTIVANRG